MHRLDVRRRPLKKKMVEAAGVGLLTPTENMELADF
jgi:hypothetical protein